MVIIFYLLVLYKSYECKPLLKKSEIYGKKMEKAILKHINHKHSYLGIFSNSFRVDKKNNHLEYGILNKKRLLNVDETYAKIYNLSSCIKISNISYYQVNEIYSSFNLTYTIIESYVSNSCNISIIHIIYNWYEKNMSLMRIEANESRYMFYYPDTKKMIENEFNITRCEIDTINVMKEPKDSGGIMIKNCTIIRINKDIRRIEINDYKRGNETNDIGLVINIIIIIGIIFSIGIIICVSIGIIFIIRKIYNKKYNELKNKLDHSNIDKSIKIHNIV